MANLSSHTVVHNLGRLANVCETEHSMAIRKEGMDKLLRSAHLGSLDSALATCWLNLKS